MRRVIGMDLHRTFAEVVVWEDGRLRHAGRVDMTRSGLEGFARTLRVDDEVVIEATGNAMVVSHLLRPHVARVVIANPLQVKAIAHAHVKTDKIDAGVLANLYAAGFLPEVWTPDAATERLRRLVARRNQVVRHRTGLKNETHAILHAHLVPPCPHADLFSRVGRAWLERQALPDDEHAAIKRHLRELDTLGEDLAGLDRAIGEATLDSPVVRRLLTVTGINVTVAAGLAAAIGDVRRFSSPQKLVSCVSACNFGSSAGSVLTVGGARSGLSGGFCSASRGVKDALPEQVEAGAAVHGALDQLQAVHLPLDRPVAPRLADGRVDSGLVLPQPGDEATEFTRGGRLQPRLQCGRIAGAHDCLEAAYLLGRGLQPGRKSTQRCDEAAIRGRKAGRIAYQAPRDPACRLISRATTIGNASTRHSAISRPSKPRGPRNDLPVTATPREDHSPPGGATGNVPVSSPVPGAKNWMIGAVIAPQPSICGTGSSGSNSRPRPRARRAPSCQTAPSSVGLPC